MNASTKKLLLLVACMFVGLQVMAQTVVSGTVTDVTGEPIIGANVVVKGTTTGTITDYDGNFELANVPAGATLSVSYLGYISLDVKASARMSVTLKEDTKALEEVVAVGYGSIRRGDATGAISSVKTDETTVGISHSAQDLLTGKIAGVNIVNSGGSPTGSASIRIRGGSSLTASNEPLIIVDGVPLDNNGIGGMGNQLSTINPNDIESFSVLKDASATAIYGSRASNGVILITTKKGSGGVVNVNYDGTVTGNFPGNYTKVYTGDQFRSLLIDQFKDESNFMDVMNLIGSENTDWQKAIFQNSVSTNHNLSIYGSAPNMPYRVTLNYDLNNGILKTNSSERFMGSVSLSPELLKKHLKIDVNGKVLYNRNRFANTGAIGTAVFFDPTQPIYDENSQYLGYFTWTDAAGVPVSNAPTNPMAMLEATDDRSYVWNFIGNVQLDYKVHGFEDLSAHVNLGMDYSDSHGYKYQDPMSPEVFSWGGYDGKWTQNRLNLLLDAYVQYAHDFKSFPSHFDIMAGYAYQNYTKDSWHLNQRITKFDAEGNPEVISTGTDKSYNCLTSFFGRINYNMLERYYFTLNLRGDASSRFAKENRWGFFPSLAFAWRIVNEDFIQTDKLSDLKFRLGWGITGQQEIRQGDYPYLGLYQWAVGDQANYLLGYDQDGNGNWVPVLRPLAYNPDLKWETTYSYNVGLDYGFLNNRIYGSLELYYRKTTDLINASTKAAAGTNFNEYVVANVGSLMNLGAEFSINAIAINTDNWTWEIGANVAYNYNRILQLTYGDNTNSYRRDGIKIQKVGCSKDSYYVYEQVYDSNGNPIEGAYVDQNKDGLLNEDDLIVFHSSTPDVTFGFNTKLTYKNWDLSLSGHGAAGNYNYYSTGANNDDMSNNSIYQTTHIYNRLVSSAQTNFHSTQSMSSYYVQDASFFRVDNITLGWSFKKSDKFPLSGRVYGTVANPFVITKYQGFDPEIDGGIDASFYPRPISVMFGVSLKY